MQRKISIFQKTKLMPDPHYPSVDFGFIENSLNATGKFDGHFTVGATTTFILSGNKAIFKRSIYVRQLDPGQVCYEQASGLAARFNFLGSLLAWLEENRHWKDGAYIVSAEAMPPSKVYSESGN